VTILALRETDQVLLDRDSKFSDYKDQRSEPWWSHRVWWIKSGRSVLLVGFCDNKVCADCLPLRLLQGTRDYSSRGARDS